MSYNLEIPYGDSVSLKGSLIFMFHQYIDMTHDKLISPATIKSPEKLSFYQFLQNGIFDLSRITYEQNVIMKEIDQLSLGPSIVYEDQIPNLFALLKQRGVWKKNGSGAWVLTTSTWEKQTIYPQNDVNAFELYYKQKYGADVINANVTSVRGNPKYVMGKGYNQEYLKKITRGDVPYAAVDMTHSTGTGAWGSEIIRGSRAFTHKTGILNAGIGYKGFAIPNNVKEMNKEIKKAVEKNLQARETRMIKLIQGAGVLYEQMDNEQQNQINKNIEKVINEQKQSLSILLRTKFENYDNTGVEFTIFGVSFVLDTGDNGVRLSGFADKYNKTDVYRGYTGKLNEIKDKTEIELLNNYKIPFLSKPQTLKMVTKQPFNGITYALRFGKYMGDFFQCIAYSHIQRKNKNNPIFLTGDGSCGLGYLLTQGYIDGPPIFMADRIGIGAANVGKPSLFYILPRKLENWANLSSITKQKKKSNLDDCKDEIEGKAYAFQESFYNNVNNANPKIDLLSELLQNVITEDPKLCDNMKERSEYLYSAPNLADYVERHNNLITDLVKRRLIKPSQANKAIILDTRKRQRTE